MGLSHEFILQSYLHRLQLPFLTEHDCKAAKLTKTPDILLGTPIYIDTRMLSVETQFFPLTLEWIDKYEKYLYTTGASAEESTIYFGSKESTRQIQEVSKAFHKAHEMGMATILWCYLRNSAFKIKEGGKTIDYHSSADLTGQANHLGVTIEADIIKQKQPENNGGYKAMGSGYGKTSKEMYDKLTSDNPIDLTRYQVLNCYAGRRRFGRID